MTTADIVVPRAMTRRPTGAWLRPGTILACGVLAVVVLAALAPRLLTAADPISGTFTPLAAPSWDHPFGTDSVGRDLFARVVHGSRASLVGASIAVAVGMTVGTLIGVVAGTQRGWVDAVAMRVVDVLLSVPALLLSLSVIILLGFGTLNAALAVGVSSVATFARLARSEVLRVAASDYVEAAYGSGGTRWGVLTRHVLPNSLSPVLGLAAVQFGSAILQLATLGFLGYGAPPPTPEWGLLIADSRDYIATAWWLTVAPGVVIIAVVVAVNHLSTLIRKEA
ncbi:ABC transporter permease [Corynebacterium uberis]|uniref:ABC transporter permease n=1 Tax=Corynebacterium TaxID=1716 RepID=UPI001D0BC6E2|nr:MULTISPECIES: ABC transporter permease [Corynebacterium]MCZ9310015.1 ABC transporter permease [Corynebacterium sp. c6VSa_13]UDL73765.1 ABC transporter permease [Corynebacterium uberis]UDL75352.1 ABC transporter permease [Corynebacterium uberis]UDL77563.1 ABC transporter permease [Corynebacterium uberis]UDL79850.1 ABC transporter permease [Corynebacterium uberis]